MKECKEIAKLPWDQVSEYSGQEGPWARGALGDGRSKTRGVLLVAYNIDPHLELQPSILLTLPLTSHSLF